MLDPIAVLEIQPGETISIVGAGGKTSLMYSLAKRLIPHYSYVITTTTTKIRPPSSIESPYIFLFSPEDRISSSLGRLLEYYSHLTIVSKPLPDNKLKGLEAEAINKLRQLLPDVPIIIEADGAAQKSLKVPAPWEPVIPEITTLVIPVVGADILGKILSEEHVFRAQLAAKLMNLPLGGVINEGHVASLLTHPQGIIKGSPPAARIIPFVNKVELLGDINQAKYLAEKIIAHCHPKIKKVLLGNAASSPLITAVIDIF
jgi:probable selenium-dependent hydroxylase accessory protein YqeC